MGEDDYRLGRRRGPVFAPEQVRFLKLTEEMVHNPGLTDHERFWRVENDTAASLGKNSRAHPIIEHTAGGKWTNICQFTELIIGSTDFDAVGLNFPSLLAKLQQRSEEHTSE